MRNVTVVLQALFFILSFGWAFPSAHAAEGDLVERAVVKTADYSSYKELYLRTLDMRNMKVKVTDIQYEGNQESVHGIKEETLNEIAVDVQKAFTEKLAVIMPVKEAEKYNAPIPGALFVDISLASLFEQERTGMFNDFVFGKKGISVTGNLEIECRLFDPVKKQVLVEFSGRRQFTTQDVSDPFSSISDKEELRGILKGWAGSVADSILRKIKKQSPAEKSKLKVLYPGT